MALLLRIQPCTNMVSTIDAPPPLQTELKILGLLGLGSI